MRPLHVGEALELRHDRTGIKVQIDRDQTDQYGQVTRVAGTPVNSSARPTLKDGSGFSYVSLNERLLNLRYSRFIAQYTPEEKGIKRPPPGVSFAHGWVVNYISSYLLTNKTVSCRMKQMKLIKLRFLFKAPPVFCFRTRRTATLKTAAHVAR